MALNEHQKAQRQETLEAVDEAVKRLSQNGVTLSLRAIAEEAGLSHSTVLQPAIKLHLYEKYPIGKSKKTDAQQEAELQAQIEDLKKKLADSKKINSKLRKDCKLLSEECDKIDLNYRHLLLQYAINIDKKISSI